MSRISEFDGAKVLANGMRMVLHCMVPYMVSEHGFWFFKSHFASMGADYVTYFMHALIMEVYMLMSGYLSPVSGDGKPAVRRTVGRLIIPCVLAWCITAPFLYALYGVEAGTSPMSLFLADFSSDGVQLLQYWYIEYLVLFTLILYFAKNPKWWWAIALMIIGWWLNDDLVIRNPRFISVRFPGFIYFAGWFLLGRTLKNNRTPLSTVPFLSVRIQSVLFVICLIVTGILMRTRLETTLSIPLHFLYKATSLGTPLFGCTVLLQVLKRWKWRPSPWLVAQNFFVYLFHLPLAIAIQYSLHILGVRSVLAPILVVLLSFAAAFGLSSLCNGLFFRLCRYITSKVFGNSKKRSNKTSKQTEQL